MPEGDLEVEGDIEEARWIGIGERDIERYGDVDAWGE